MSSVMITTSTCAVLADGARDGAVGEALGAAVGLELTEAGGGETEAEAASPARFVAQPLTATHAIVAAVIAMNRDGAFMQTG